MALWQHDPHYIPTSRQRANTRPHNRSNEFTSPPRCKPARWADVYRMRTAGKGWIEIATYLGVQQGRVLEMYRRAEQIIAYGPCHLHFKHFLEFVPAEEPVPLPPLPVEPSEPFKAWCSRVLDSYREALRV